jgi:hypothetical protein
MKEFRWDIEKGALLKAERGVSFEEMIQAPLLGIAEHPNRTNQKLLVFLFEGYVWVAPFVESDEELFLKTMYPSRRFQRLWKNGLLNLS